jgi:hypothetical protein
MKVVPFRSFVTCALSAGVLLVACSSGDSGDMGAFPDSGAAVDAEYKDSGNFQPDSGSPSNENDSGSTEHDSGSSSEASTGGSCGSCTTNSECETTCPAVKGGGTNCCDLGSGVCYATTQSTCPAPSDGGSE